MITHDNIYEIVNALNVEDKKNIAESNFDYVILSLMICNAGSSTSVTLTNDIQNNLAEGLEVTLPLEDPIFDKIKDGF